ncbi:metallophosphoesterase family protein [Dermatobacter hominis]|uniref:metallophosphoesterase family protein n=1 Tax=Dermatobacter hominis TaxID=2884263 RepID=UPI001D1079C9|nr:metallophosphoesterase [Dermatobacter hominis]UDY34138.1 metallophosphoesterase [Dermatobacter hominis]
MADPSDDLLPEPMPPEVMTVADDEVVVFHGPIATTWTDLPPDTDLDLDGVAVRTLPRRGELLATVATANDVHFGEIECGHIDGVDWETYTVEPGEPPYPETMNAAVVADMAARRPDAVVVKGDVTSDGTDEQVDRFLDVYGGAFGDDLMWVRGNHESYHHQQRGAWPVQERTLDGVVLAVLDTSRDATINGHLSAEQLEWLDELGARADRPVLVFGHHPVWNPAEERRREGVFGLVPGDTEALAEVFVRRPRLLGYFAGHTHRNNRVRLPGAGDVPFVEVGTVKDYPGSWAEYRVFDGLVLQVHRRVTAPDALDWSERTRGMFAGTYARYARGRLSDRCFAIEAR